MLGAAIYRSPITTTQTNHPCGDRLLQVCIGYFIVRFEQSVVLPSSAGILSGSNTAKTMKKSNEPMSRPASNYSSARNDGAAAVSTSLDGHNSNYNNNGREKDPSPPMATSGLQSTFSNRVRRNVQASRYQDNFSAPIPTQENTATGRAAAAAAENEREKERNSKIGKTRDSYLNKQLSASLSYDYLWILGTMQNVTIKASSSSRPRSSAGLFRTSGRKVN